MTTYSLEEALPLVREGREFTFYYDSVDYKLVRKSELPFHALVNSEFYLISKCIENIDELKHMTLAWFKNIRVHKNNAGKWFYPNGNTLEFDDSACTVKNWREA